MGFKSRETKRKIKDAAVFHHKCPTCGARLGEYCKGIAGTHPARTRLTGAPGPTPGPPPTARQERALERYGVRRIPATKGEAQDLIDKHAMRHPADDTTKRQQDASSPPTPKQIARLKELGVQEIPPTKGQAQHLINELSGPKSKRGRRAREARQEAKANRLARKGVTVSYVCPICGGPHPRKDHPLPTAAGQ